MNYKTFSVLAIGILLLGCDEKTIESSAVVPKVKLVEASATNTSKARRISGKLVAADKTQLSFAVSGTVDKVLVSAGQAIDEGDILARLDKKSFENSLDTARAELSIARAQLNEKKQRFQRLQELLEKRVISVSDYEVAESELSVARGNLKVAQTALEDATSDLEDITLRAPFAGKIAERLIDPFQEVSAGTVAFNIESEGNLEVELLVPESMIHQVDYGQTVSVSFPTRKNLNIAGYVSEVGSQVVAGNAFPIRVQLGQKDSTLRSGMSAIVEVILESDIGGQNRYLLPISSLALDAGLLEAKSAEGADHDRTAPVFKFNAATSSLELIHLKVGDLRGNQLEVFDGLEEGDLIVSAGVPFLRDGMKVKPWDPENGLLE